MDGYFNIIASHRASKDEMKQIHSTHDNGKLGKFVMVYFFRHHSKYFGRTYQACYSIQELNDVKGELINNGFQVNWDSFSKAMRYLNNCCT